MLQTLSIQNLALIEKLTLNFKTGFTSLTGETGAGKSILLDALGLTLGERADSGLVRHETPRADVTADFDITNIQPAQQWLAEHELDEENECLLRRTITAEGRSKAYINGLPVSAKQLKQLSTLLIDIHGQHEHQALTQHTKQLALLDDYAQHPALVKTCQTHHKSWATLNKQYQDLLASKADHESKIELLRFQQQEFENLSPAEGEFKDISSEQNLLSHASDIKLATDEAHTSLDGEGGAAQSIAQAITHIEGIVSFQPELEDTLKQLNSLLIEIQETASDLQMQNSQIDIDPNRLEEVSNRLSDLFSMAKKYQIDPDALLDKHQKITDELAAIEHASHSLEHMDADIALAWQVFMKSAKILSTSRKKSAIKLGKTVSQTMATLGMPNGQFAISLSLLDTPTRNGIDKSEFQVTANQGQPLQALAKVASGGELSRISLSIQVACAEVISLATLIFDEVDVGIGGGTAEVVGQKMRELGLKRQILSITHLAQVASYGNQHLNIEKSSKNNSTTTQVIEISEDKRVQEIARMLGGVNITEQTRKHAKEMIDTAKSHR